MSLQTRQTLLATLLATCFSTPSLPPRCRATLLRNSSAAPHTDIGIAPRSCRHKEFAARLNGRVVRVWPKKKPKNSRSHCSNTLKLIANNVASNLFCNTKLADAVPGHVAAKFECRATHGHWHHPEVLPSERRCCTSHRQSTTCLRKKTLQGRSCFTSARANVNNRNSQADNQSQSQRHFPTRCSLMSSPSVKAPKLKFCPECRAMLVAVVRPHPKTGTDALCWECYYCKAYRR